MDAEVSEDNKEAVCVEAEIWNDMMADKIMVIITIGLLTLISKHWNANSLSNVSTTLLIRLYIIYDVYISDGSCKFGDKCSYAHGDSELRVAPTDG